MKRLKNYSAHILLFVFLYKRNVKCHKLTQQFFVSA